MAGKNIIELSDELFATTIGDGGTPVMVDFWADWCVPCKRIAPIVEELADQYAGRLRVGKINIDQHQAAANQFGIQSIPTLLLFKNGQLARKINGAVPKDMLVEAIDSVL